MTTGHSSHTEVVREQFRIQSAQFEEQVGGGYNRDIPGWILDNLALTGNESALDVATGTGIMARDLAPRVAHVTGIDVTPEMLAQARRIASDAGIANIAFDDGDAAALPYPDNQFDLVISRIAVHHFANPEVELGEMRRVCQPEGRVVIVDITAADDAALAEAHNRLERLRDPSHTTACSVAGLTALAERCALKVVHTGETDAVRDLDEWLDLTAAPASVRQTVTAAFEAELAGGTVTGMQAFREAGRLKFVHHWAVLVCELTGE